MPIPPAPWGALSRLNRALQQGAGRDPRTGSSPVQLNVRTWGLELKGSWRAYRVRFAPVSRPVSGHSESTASCHEPTSLAAVGEAAVAIECETEMRSQRSDGRVLPRIGIGIGCGNDDDPEPAAILATRRQHRCSQCIAIPVAQREEKRHLSLYMGLEADVALDRVGPLRMPGLDCLLPLDRKSTRLNSSHLKLPRMPSSA